MDNVNKEKMVLNAIFKFNNETYYLFLGDRCRKFYLKEKEGKLEYISLEEYMAITKELFSTNNMLNRRNHVFIKPFIKVKNKIVPFALVGSMLISMTGCATKEEKTISGLSNIGIELEDVSEFNDMYYVTQIKNGGKNVYQNCDWTILKDMPYSIKCTPSTFSNYIGKSDVSYDDLRKITESNSNIPKELKEIIIEGINNLEKSDFKINYSVLYYNLERMTVEYVPESEVYGNSGIFEYSTASVKINENLKDKMTDAEKKIILHEVLGHGSTTAYNEEKGVLCSLTNLYINVDESGAIMDMGQFGFSLDDGMAEIIASKALGRPLTVNENGYPTFIYGLSLFCSTLDVSVEDYANQGVNVLVEKMNERGISDPYQMICELDNISTLVNSDSLLKSDSTQLYIDYLDQLLKLGVDKGKISESLAKYKKYVLPINNGESNLLIYGPSYESYDMIEPDRISEYIENYDQVKTH